MTIQVRKDLTMRSLTPEDAREIFDVIDQNRGYLRRWLPWVDGTASPDTVRRSLNPGKLSVVQAATRYSESFRTTAISALSACMI
jgi:hypothetical protein